MNNKNIRLAAGGLLRVHWLFPDATFWARSTRWARLDGGRLRTCPDQLLVSYTV